MEHYVTLFDRLFLPQGLALHASLERYAGEYTLWVLCMDGEVKEILDQLDKPNIKTIALGEIETPELIAVKKNRTKGEYCWTMTSFTPKIVFERDKKVERVTYLDADLFFLKSPQPIFEEFEKSGKSVLITDHAYATEYDQSATNGKYCVQFVTFVRDISEPVRQWWQERCVEWCYARFENGKFGDQKYLDDWPERFGDYVHVLQAKHLTLAPWNITRFTYNEGVFYHFHGLRLLSRKRILLFAGYSVRPEVIKNVYHKYLKDFFLGISELKMLGIECVPQRKHIGFFYYCYRIAMQFKRKLLLFIDFHVTSY